MMSELAGWCVGEGGLSLLYTQKVSKIAAVNATARRFGTDDFVKKYFRVKEQEGARTQLSITFENFKISLLLTEI
jgi:hypothetical protein